MASTRQTSFAGGELAPLLHGRSDLAKYATGLRRLRDFFVSKHGAAVSRPGTVTVRRSKFEETVGDDGNVLPIRLIPFVYSDTQTYVLEFGNLYIRFHSDGGTVMNGASPLEVATTYAASDLAQIQWAQSGDVLTLVHPSYAPRTLTRTSHTVWAIEDVSFARSVTVTSAYLLDNGAVMALPAEDIPNGLVAREWQWQVTEILRHSITGLVYETAPFTITEKTTGLTSPSAAGGASTAPSRIPVYPSKPVMVVVAAHTLPPQTTRVATRVYRGRGGLFGWVGDGLPDTYQCFTDAGQEPDYAITPPQGLNPFASDYPAAVTFFQDRLVLGGTPLLPERVKLSATSDYHNFDQRQIPIASEALDYGFLSRKREDIRSFLGLDSLLIGTGQSNYSFDPGGDALAPDAASRFRVIEEIGVGHLPYLSVGGSALYARNKGGGVRSLTPGGQGGWQGSDLSAVASHFFVGTDYELADWTYAEDPWGIIWACRADGALLSLTYSQQDEMWAWALHTLAGSGLVHSVCAVPEGSEDAVYLAVERTAPDQDGGLVATMFIERMASRVRYGITSDDVCLDAAVQYSGALATALSPSGLSELDGRSVYVTGKDNPVQGPYTVASGAITLDELPIANNGAAVVLYVGLLYQPELETLNASAGARMRTPKAAWVEVNESRGFSVGGSLTTLKEWRQRKVSDSYDATTAATEVVPVPTTGTWAEHGRVAIRQTQPLPLVVVGIRRVLEMGDE